MTIVSKILNIIIISFYSSTFLSTSPVSASIAPSPFLSEVTYPSPFLSYSYPRKSKYEGLRRIESLRKCILRTSYHYSLKSKPLLVIRNSNWAADLLSPKVKLDNTWRRKIILLFGGNFPALTSFIYSTI